jgi:hypothetical protein
MLVFIGRITAEECRNKRFKIVSSGEFMYMCSCYNVLNDTLQIIIRNCL